MTTSSRIRYYYAQWLSVSVVARLGLKHFTGIYTCHRSMLNWIPVYDSGQLPSVSALIRLGCMISFRRGIHIYTEHDKNQTLLVGMSIMLKRLATCYRTENRSSYACRITEPSAYYSNMD